MTELTDENDHLRSLLGLQPATRPPLGRGPTGKDRPKTYDGSSTARGESLLGEDSASPRTSHSSPQSTIQQIHAGPSTQSANSGNNPGTMWDSDMTMPQHDEYGSGQELRSSMAANTSAASSSYVPEQPYRFDAAQSSRSRTSFPGAVFPSQGTSGYHYATDRVPTSGSNFPREDTFYPMAPASSSSRNANQSSPALHPHSLPHHMESAMGGGGHSPMSTPTSFSPASPSPPVSLSMALGPRRSIQNLQHNPTYVDPYSSASYTQRAQSGIPHQPHNIPNAPSTSSRLPLNYPGVSRPEYTGTEPSPTGEPSFRRPT